MLQTTNQRQWLEQVLLINQLMHRGRLTSALQVCLPICKELTASHSAAVLAPLVRHAPVCAGGVWVFNA